MNENQTMHTFDSNHSRDLDEFLNRTIKQVEQMVSELAAKDREIAAKKQEIFEKDKRIEELLVELEQVKQNDVLGSFEVKQALEKVLQMAEESSRKIEENARIRADAILEDAKRNADRIINESLLRASKVEIETNILRRNLKLFKSKLKQSVEYQLEMIEDIEKVDI